MLHHSQLDPSSVMLTKRRKQHLTMLLYPGGETINTDMVVWYGRKNKPLIKTSSLPYVTHSDAGW